MGKLSLFSAIFLTLALSGCEKDYDFEKSSPNPDPNGDYNYVYNPKPMEYLGSAYVSGLTRTDVWDYRFKISLGNSKVNPNGLTIKVPHVGPGGTTIYDNVSNDAYYTVTVTYSDGYAYLTIRTATMVTTGCKLKFNLSAGNNTWFLASGSYVQNPTLDHATDDGANNLYCVIFKDGTISPGIN